MRRFVVVLGPKHSGKSSAGAALARRLGIPFYDLDLLIEERAGQSPRSLFASGEEIFRREEAAALGALLAEKDGGVLAAGGGIIDNPAALALLGEGDLTVNLEISAAAAWGRITGAGELPPFLRAESPEEAEKKHRLLHERRAASCKALARYSIGAEGKSPEELAEEICRLLSKTNSL